MSNKNIQTPSLYRGIFRWNFLFDESNKNSVYWGHNHKIKTRIELDMNRPGAVHIAQLSF